jgi:hypothetical protein
MTREAATTPSTQLAAARTTGLPSSGQPLTRSSWRPTTNARYSSSPRTTLSWAGSPARSRDGCHKDAKLSSHGMCQTCWLRWRNTRGITLEQFLQAPKPRQHAIGVSPCEVGGCQRLWKSAIVRLCVAHDWQRKQTAGQSLSEFLSRTDLTPFPTSGSCSVAACTPGTGPARGPYCHTHQQRFAAAARQEPQLDVGHWNRTTPAVAENGEVSLRGLHPSRR